MPSPAEMARVFQAWASYDEMTDEACAVVGAAAISTPTMTEAEYLDGFASNAAEGWPDKPLLINAVDCASGVLRVFDAHSNVPIERALAASCAVPGMFPPVTIDGRRYTDGGVRSGTSADLAQRIEPDSVLVIAPIGGGGESRVGAAIARSMSREIAALESAGAKVKLVLFDDATRAAAGASLMDPAGAPAVSLAGEAQGRSIAAEVRALWQ
jgi:NTE family protein